MLKITSQNLRPPPLRQMTDFTLTPPILAAILCNALPLVFQPLPPPFW